MNLNNIDIKLAERTDPQAVNLGFVTARRYFAPLFLASVFAVTPVLVVAVLLLWFYQAYFWSSLLVWWCKPFYDRVILLNASRLLFRESLSVWDIFDSLGKATRHGLWLNLTFYRFSTTRSLTLPVFVLEQLSGGDYRERVKIVSRGSASAASAAMIGLLHIEAVLYFNAFLFLMMILPDSVTQPVRDSFRDMSFLFSAGDWAWLNWLGLLLQTSATAVIEVFYTMVGFMLYLNSRIKTEGWHIELAFRQIADRLAGRSDSLSQSGDDSGDRRVAMAWAATLLLSGALAFAPTTAKAQSQTQIQGQNQSQNQSQSTSSSSIPATLKLTPEQDKSILKKLLLDKAINPYKVQGKWEKKNLQRRQADNDWNFGNLGRLSQLASVVKMILILLGLLLIYWAIVNRDRFAFLWQGRVEVEDDTKPHIMFGLDLRRESLPDDIAGEAARLLQAGNAVAALSLLYRGSLAALIHDHDVTIKESDTEGDCLRASQRRVGHNTYCYFESLTRTWQQVVYAHRAPEQQRLTALIRDWKMAFNQRLGQKSQDAQHERFSEQEGGR